MFKEKINLISIMLLLLVVFITISSVSAQSISDIHTSTDSNITYTNSSVDIANQNLIENTYYSNLLSVDAGNDVLGAKVAPEFSVTPNGTQTIIEGDNITFTVTGPNNVTGLITITGDKEGVIKNFKGMAQKSFEFLNEGTYVLNFQYEENNDYSSANVMIPIEVKRPDPISVYDLPITATNITYNVTNAVITVNLPNGAKKDGLNIIVNNVIYPSEDYIWDATTNVVTLSIPNLDAGNYSATASYEDEKYALNTNTTSFTVDKAIVEFTIKDVNIDYGEEAKVIIKNLDAIVGQIVTISVDNITKKAIVNEDGKATKKFSDLSAGNYTITASCDEKNHEYIFKPATLTVNKASTSINISVNETYYVDDNVVITLTPSIDLPIKVTINGKEYEVSENNTVTLTAVNGTYIVVATLEGDENHIGSQSNATFYVNKLTPDINVNPLPPVVIDGSIMELNITGPDDINGMVVVSGDLNYVIDNFNGSYNLSFSDLEPGFYNINITYIENNKYTKETVSTNITVEPKDDVPMEISDIQIEYGETAKVVVTGLDNIIGQEIIIEVNGVIKTITVNNKGKASAKFNDLDADEYQIYAYYPGDDLHYATEANAILTVLPTNTTIDISVDETYYVDDNVVITLTPSIDLPIKVTINGKEYEVSENNTVTLTAVNGTYIVVATLEGDENHIGSQSNATFYVNKLTPDINVNPLPPVVIDGSIMELNITGPDDINGMVVVSGDLNYVIDNFNGSYNLSFSDLEPGFYNINITYIENNKYTKETVSTNITVEPKDDVPMEISDVESEYGEAANVVVTGLDDIVGQEIIIEVNNFIKPVTVDNTGKASAKFNDLETGKYQILAYYYGDDLHYASEAIAILTVLPTNTTIDININESYKTGDNVEINVTLDDNTTGYVNIIVDGSEHVVKLLDSMATYTLENAQYGEHTVYVKYFGDKNHNEALSDEIKFYVEKRESNLYIDDIVTDLSNNITTVSIAITNDKIFNITGNVTVIVIYDELMIKEVTANVNEYNITIDLGVINPGSYTIGVIYSGNDYYEGDFNAVEYEVPLVTNYDLPILASNGTYNNETVGIIVNLPKNASMENLLIIIGNDIYGSENFTQIDDYIILLIDDLDAGNYSASAVYLGDDIYDLKSNSTSFTVFKAPSTIDIEVDEIYSVDDNVVITLIPSFSNSTIKVTINGKEYEVSENNTVTLTAVNGTYIVVATLEGDKNHIGSQSNATFYVNKITPEITVDVPFSYAYDGQLIIVELPSDATGLVTAEINGTLYASFVDNGTAVINVPNLSSGNYTTIVTYPGDDKYESVNTSENFNIKDHLEVFAPDVVKYYKGSERFEVEVIFNNQPREGQTVRITINGVEYKKTTDKNGIASLALNLDEGNYSVLVRVDDLEFNSSVTILPTVFGKDISKIFKNGTQYYATFTDSEGNLLVNKEVTFNINGVFYNRTTDNNGVAKLNINLQPGEYIITAYNPITGDTYANNIYVLSHFVEHDDLEKIYGSSTPFVIRLCDDQGNIETSGKTVTFNINGVFYNRTSDSNGYVKLNINLMAGEYIITSIYGDEAISDKITVHPQLN